MKDRIISTGDIWTEEHNSVTQGDIKPLDDDLFKHIEFRIEHPDPKALFELEDLRTIEELKRVVGWYEKNYNSLAIEYNELYKKYRRMYKYYHNIRKLIERKAEGNLPNFNMFTREYLKKHLPFIH